MKFLTSPLLERLPHIFHGFGMRTDEPVEGIRFPKQVHGDRIAVLEEPVPETWHDEADAVLTSCPSLPIGIRTADCLPILVADREGRGVGAVHAGWKGMARGVLPKAIQRFCAAFGVTPETLILAVGPGIGACCLEVDDPVREFFLEQGREPDWNRSVRVGRKGHWWLDLKLMAQQQALGAGVKQENVDVLAYCTCCESDYFHSYRRDGLAAGRQVNYIVLTGKEGI